MAKRSVGEKRSEFIARAGKAVKAGWSQARFLREASRREITFRRTDMISQWHAVAETQKKAGLYRYVRKDYVPSAAVMAEVPWKLSREFMYKVAVRARTAPGEPITERFVNIMQDRPMTPAEIERLAWGMMMAQSPAQAVLVERITPWTVIRRVE